MEDLSPEVLSVGQKEQQVRTADTGLTHIGCTSIVPSFPPQLFSHIEKVIAIIHRIVKSFQISAEEGEDEKMKSLHTIDTRPNSKTVDDFKGIVIL